MKVLFLIIILFLAVFARANDIEQYEKIRVWLSGYEWSLDESQLPHLGKNPEQILMQIAQDRSLLSYYHFRALKALTLFQTPEVADFLQKYTESIDSESHQRRSLEAFVVLFQEQYPHRTAILAEMVLQSKDPQSRITAYRVLKKLPQHLVGKVLKNFDLSQQPRWVAEQLRTSSSVY